MTVVECSKMVFDRSADCVRQARLAVAEACRGMARDLVAVAQLLTSELVTNALQHGAGAIHVEVSRSSNRLHVSVEDNGPDLPQRHDAGPDSINGRGLMLVESLATRWGVRPQSPGKRVWFELKTV